MSRKIEVSAKTLNEIVKYYIEENHSKKETMFMFNLGSTKLKNLLAENGFKKTTKCVKSPKKKIEGRYENRLKCLICGKSDVLNLYQHIKLLHHITIEEYRDMFNYQGNFVATPDSNLKKRMGIKKDNFQAWNKGLTKETDSRIKCNVGRNLGKKRTKEQRDFISKRTKEGMNNDVVRNKIIESNKNRVITKEQRDLFSKLARERWNNIEYAKRCSNHKFGNRNVYKDITFQSDSELLFAKKCDELGIKWKYHIGCFKYLLRRDNKYHNYFPDFYLEDYDIYIEIKYRKNYLYGCDDKLKDKLDGMKFLGLKCILLDRRDFKNLINILNNADIG